jgi:hypothetical protein
MKRHGDRANSILRAEVIEDPQQLKRLAPPPPWFDVRPILERLWGMSKAPAPRVPLAPDSADGAPDVLPFPPPATDAETPPAKPARRNRQ